MISRDRLKEKKTHKATDGPTPAERALAEAEERRKQAAAVESAKPKELGGPEGPEPTRYGDWEKSGIVSDF